MKTIRNNLFAFVMMYKTSLSINPIITTIGTFVVGAFVYSVLKIFGL